jgi:hypothetical protein
LADGATDKAYAAVLAVVTRRGETLFNYSQRTAAAAGDPDAVLGKVRHELFDRRDVHRNEAPEGPVPCPTRPRKLHISHRVLSFAAHHTTE